MANETKGNFLNSEKIVGPIEFTVRTDAIGDVFINGKFYRQLSFTPNQIAFVIEDFLNGVPADNEDDKEVGC